MLNQEVREDSQTVQEIFPGKCFEVIVPAGSSLTRNQLIELKDELYNLMAKLKNSNATEVNIVLNTHGSPGQYDLDASFINTLIQQLSAEDIKINTVYALMCDGFTKRKASDGPTALYKSSLLFQDASPLKPSSMEILRVKLNNLETKMVQYFPIKGFAYPYTPSIAKSMIIKFLRDEDVSATVYVRTIEQKEVDYDNLLSYIEMLRNEKRNPQTPAYIQASNALGLLIHEIKKHIDEYLIGYDEKLDKGSIPLFASVLNFAKLDSEELTFKQFDNNYKRWLKEFKLTSPTRLDLLQEYCNYQKGCKNEPTLLLRENSQFTLFSCKIDLRDEPKLSDEPVSDAERQQNPGKSHKF